MRTRARAPMVPRRLTATIRTGPGGDRVAEASPTVAALPRRRTIFYGWQIAGAGALLQLIQSALAGQAYGLLYDQTGTYRAGFDILAAMAATGSIFFLLARKPVKRTLA